jgi:hypothetical protein
LLLAGLGVDLLDVRDRLGQLGVRQLVLLPGRDVQELGDR